MIKIGSIFGENMDKKCSGTLLWPTEEKKRKNMLQILRQNIQHTAFEFPSTLDALYLQLSFTHVSLSLNDVIIT